MLLAAVEYPVIESQASLVGLGLLPGGEDAGPVDGGAENLESHLGKEGDVLLVVMVKVNGFVTRIELVWADGSCHPFGSGYAAVGAMIGDALPFAVQVPASLKLVGGAGAAPEEAFWECCFHK